jgi:hypothetical protein
LRLQHGEAAPLQRQANQRQSIEIVVYYENGLRH